ncbi:hypothetical protein NO932_06545 [Pelagibacterium sp. 26DY04]|uniref:hypothetical protein n=1 Tax=Pelagibacterium sp. 26DY04 TaxID=2967130 RepID=UPI002815ED87|nr:hypothetical protein [Pelagibacterium sp. 26DY04]WMT88264.1 hypothetical protein NO932_06545 [Pelagibacterium sp. 26DY04]
MTTKVPLAEQIGELSDVLDETAKATGYRAEQRIRKLTAAKASLAWLMNNSIQIKAFMAGKEGCR